MSKRAWRLICGAVFLRDFETVGRHHFCFQFLNDNDVMIVEGDFFAEPKQCPSTVTVAEICERFTAAGLPCKAERQEGEVRIIFAGRKSNLIFTVNPSGRPLTAKMQEEADYDADFACILFEVFDSIGWCFMPDED